MQEGTVHTPELNTHWTFRQGDFVRVTARPESILMVLGTHAEAGMEVVWVWTGPPEDGLILLETFNPKDARERFNETQRLQEFVRFYPASVLECAQ